MKLKEYQNNNNQVINNTFYHWNSFKISLHHNKKEVFAYPKDIWWISLGVNIGTETNGKNESFERPALVLKVFNKNQLLIAPLSSQRKTSPYHVEIYYPDGAPTYLNLSQMRIISSKRLLRFITKINHKDFARIIKIIKEEIF